MAEGGDLFGIYVHWPFCLSKCPYCDFNSHVREAVEQTRWRAALQAELAHFAARTQGRRVTSIFFGGGTPSLMPVETAAGVIETVRRLWPVAGDLEITLEANPTSVEAARLAGLREAGVNRVSLGVQALEAADLRFLGRGHSVDEAIAAIAVARDTFGRFSFDLIYGRPGQSVDAWRSELARGLALAGEHLSLYQLTIERGTRFFQDQRRGAFVMPDDDLMAELFEATQDVLEASGRPAYEISNHAQPGRECRHNLTYWRYADYVGVGPGAHGRLMIDPARPAAGKYALRATSGPEAWLEQVEAQGCGTASIDAVEGRELLVESLMMGLRLAEGVDIGRLVDSSGIAADRLFDRRAVDRLVTAELLSVSNDRIAATRAGRQRLNAVLQHLLT